MIQADQLKHEGISHGFFDRGGGYSTGIFASLNCGLGSGDDPEKVQLNRQTIARSLGVEATALVSLWQVHGNAVIEVKQPWSADERPKADAMVCRTPGIAIGILTADCAPVLFCDAKAGVVGACHAGWKGALDGVTTNTITAMEGIGAKRRNVCAVIGPTISLQNYEVGPEFITRFTTANASNERFFKPSNKEHHYMFDLPAYLLQRLQQDGVGECHNINRCTYADEAMFFSYRRATHRGESDYGRLMAAIALV
jgi:polyphenol oxidase